MLRSQSAKKAAQDDGESGSIAYAYNKENVWPVVSFRGLKADGVKPSDIGGTSDPYIVFHTNPLIYTWRHPHKTDHKGIAYPPQTAIISKTLNPRWDDEKVPMLPSGD